MLNCGSTFNTLIQVHIFTAADEDASNQLQSRNSDVMKALDEKLGDQE